MKLPKQVQRQVSQAEAALAAMNAPAPEAPAPATEAPPAPSPADPPAPVEAETQTPSAPPAADPVAPPPPAPAKNDEATWEARYRTLQGLHNQNIADLKGRLQDSERARQDLEKRLSAMEQRLAAPPAPAVTDSEDAEVFGADLVDMVRRIATQAVADRVGAFDSRVGEVEKHLSGTTKAVAQTAEEVFLSRLAARVPDYQEVNANDAFLAWLGEADPVYGVPRQAALDSAAQALDVARVATIFEAFKATQAKPAAAPATKPASALERQVAPNAGVAASVTAPATPEVVTQDEVARFYADVSRGRYRGREKQQAETEARINRALAEGRVV